MSDLPAFVVGAGPSGLGCAIALAAETPVVLIDRIPVVGGAWGWRQPDVRGLARQAEDAGVTFVLGATGCRWESTRLLLASPGRISWASGRALFYAGGRRPATAAEMRLLGERPAGILPATVAHHLLEAGIPLWKRPAILGSGPWASAVAESVHAHRGFVSAVAAGSPVWADATYGAPEWLEAVGRERIQGVRLHSVGHPQYVECDALILAADPRPTRNVDGALEDGADKVVFVQPLAEESVGERSEAGKRIARQWLRCRNPK